MVPRKEERLCVALCGPLCLFACLAFFYPLLHFPVLFGVRFLWEIWRTHETSRHIKKSQVLLVRKDLHD